MSAHGIACDVGLSENYERLRLDGKLIKYQSLRVHSYEKGKYQLRRTWEKKTRGGEDASEERTRGETRGERTWGEKTHGRRGRVA